ncbi:MAG: hypothetical protein ACM30E_05075 [Nitrososphaerales archaeon]
MSVATRNAPTNGRVLDVSLGVGSRGVAISWVQDTLSGGMGVYESRYNMPPIMLKSYLPLLMIGP